MNTDVKQLGEKNEDPQDTLEGLREELRAQRIEQKATLAKLKRTTYLACEIAKKGTTYFNRDALLSKLEKESGESCPTLPTVE